MHLGATRRYKELAGHSRHRYNDNAYDPEYHQSQYPYHSQCSRQTNNVYKKYKSTHHQSTHGVEKVEVYFLKITPDYSYHDEVENPNIFGYDILQDLMSFVNGHLDLEDDTFTKSLVEKKYEDSSRDYSYVLLSSRNKEIAESAVGLLQGQLWKTDFHLHVEPIIGYA